MGTVLLFRPTSGQTRSSIRQERLQELSEPPKLLLFTGVRYERHAEEPQPAEPPSPSAGGKKRRRRG